MALRFMAWGRNPGTHWPTPNKYTEDCSVPLSFRDTSIAPLKESQDWFLVPARATPQQSAHWQPGHSSCFLLSVTWFCLSWAWCCNGLWKGPSLRIHRTLNASCPKSLKTRLWDMASIEENSGISSIFTHKTMKKQCLFAWFLETRFCSK